MLYYKCYLIISEIHFERCLEGTHVSSTNLSVSKNVRHRQRISDTYPVHSPKKATQTGLGIEYDILILGYLAHPCCWYSTECPQ